LPMTRVTGVSPDAAAARPPRRNPFRASTSTAASAASAARPMLRKDAAAVVVARVFVLVQKWERVEEEEVEEEDEEGEDERGAGEGACFDAMRGDTRAYAGYGGRLAPVRMLHTTARL